MSYQEFLEKLNPKVAKALRTASTSEIVKLELASIGLTEDLGGGIAKGRVTLVYGSPSAGKTLLLLQSIAKWQKRGLVCAWIDVESAYDKEWAARVGVNNDELILISSKSSGRIEDEVRPLLEAEVDVLVIDSVSDVLPEVFMDKKGEMNSQIERKQLGAHAKAITALVNGIHYLNKSTAVVLISQTTTKIEQTYVEQVPHGGQKILFASSQIIQLKSSGSPNSQIEDDIETDGQVFKRAVARDVTYIVRKNKLGSPFGTGEYRIYYAGDFVGIDTMRELVDSAIAFGVIRKASAWLSYGEQQWQGKDNLMKELRANEALYDEILADLKVARNGGEVAGDS